MQAIAAKINQTAANSAVLRFYHRFEPLAEKYAWRIYRAHKIGFEFEDLVQEFKLKIYLSIIAYAKYFEKKQPTRYKPCSIECYIRQALANKTKDFIKAITETPDQAYSVEADGFDYSEIQSMESHIVWSARVCKCEINGIDLLEGLSHLEARCFMLFLRGYTITKLRKIFAQKLPTAAEVIHAQVAKLQSKKEVLLHNTVGKYMNFFTDKEN